MTAINYGSDQDILEATLRKDGGLYFPELDFYVQVEGDIKAPVLIEWCGYVRSEHERQKEQALEESRARLAREGRGRNADGTPQNPGGGVPPVAQDISGPKENESVEDFLIRKADALHMQRDRLVHIMDALELQMREVADEQISNDRELEKVQGMLDTLGIDYDRKDDEKASSPSGGDILSEDNSGGDGSSERVVHEDGASEGQGRSDDGSKEAV